MYTMLVLLSIELFFLRNNALEIEDFKIYGVLHRQRMKLDGSFAYCAQFIWIINLKVEKL